jgi:hypothetical protein
MKRYILLFLILCSFIISKAQKKDFYGLIYEGEGNAKTLCIKCNEHPIFDTLSIIEYGSHSFPDPPWENIKDWSVWFKKNIPLKVKIDSFKLSGNDLRFQTAKCFHDDSLWFSFQFKGKVVRNQIKGRITVNEFTGIYNHVYTDDYTIIFNLQ